LTLIRGSSVGSVISTLGDGAGGLTDGSKVTLAGSSSGI